MAEHGTVARYKKHARDRDEACRPCKDANNEYQNELRLIRPEIAEVDRLRKRATSKAHTRLRHKYPADFELLYQDELRKAKACADKLVSSATPE